MIRWLFSVRNRGLTSRFSSFWRLQLLIRKNKAWVCLGAIRRRLTRSWGMLRFPGSLIGDSISPAGNTEGEIHRRTRARPCTDARAQSVKPVSGIRLRVSFSQRTCYGEGVKVIAEVASLWLFAYGGSQPDAWRAQVGSVIRASRLRKWSRRRCFRSAVGLKKYIRDFLGSKHVAGVITPKHRRIQQNCTVIWFRRYWENVVSNFQYVNRYTMT